MKLKAALSFYIIFFCLVSYTSFAQREARPFWSEIQAFMKEDRLNPPPASGTLFVGSSSFRLWNNLQDYFPELNIVNRGFGGSTLSDLVFYADSIVTPFQWKYIVIYSGENDLVYDPNLEPSEVVNLFNRLMFLVRKTNPQTPVFYCSIKPSPIRKQFSRRFVQYNNLISNHIDQLPNTFYVDVWNILTSKDEQAESVFFLADSLHLNEKGYSLWKNELNKYLK